jgi:hypothetical protein
MSYLFPDASATELGVVQVGSNIDVDANSVISIPQSVATTASVTFGNVTDSALTAGRVTFAGTAGLLSDDGDLTYNPTTNTLTAVNVSVSGALTLSGSSVVTSVTPTAGTGISLTGVTTSGPAAAFTVNNTGVTSAVAGTGISVSSGTGAVTIANTGVTSIVAGTNISISSATGVVTISASGAALITTVGTATAYTALATDEYIGVTANPTTVTLPAGVAGKTYIVKNETTGTTTVTGTGGELLDTTATKTLSARASISVVFRAGAWRII